MSGTRYTPEQIKAFRLRNANVVAAVKQGKDRGEVAKEFGISRSRVDGLVQRESWREIPAPPLQIRARSTLLQRLSSPTQNEQMRDTLTAMLDAPKIKTGAIRGLKIVAENEFEALLDTGAGQLQPFRFRVTPERSFLDQDVYLVAYQRE